MDQAHSPRRFYARAEVAPKDGGFRVMLDDRPLKTAAGREFILPSRALAERCAEEWAAQGEQLDTSTMPITKLGFVAVDLVQDDRAARADFVASFSETDLCCHRASGPAELVARQDQTWNPLVEWGNEEFGVAFPIVRGVIAAPEAAALRSNLRALALMEDDYKLTALAQCAGLSGSCLIAFAVLRGRLAAREAFEAAALDELWSLEHWGEDEVARARLTQLENDFAAARAFLVALDVG
ncbi:MAG: ATPase [Hyphomonadaceae bacterium]|nr:ATPase [Hyphomonadaceae bacterium]